MTKKDIRRSRAPLHMAQPDSLKRRQIDDTRAKVEATVARVWAEKNIPHQSYNYGLTPIDHLCPKVVTGKGELNDPTAVIAINSTIQWLFGTAVGRNVAEELFGIEEKVFATRNKNRKK